MTDLQEKAMRMALEALDYHFDNVDVDAYWPYVLEAKQALRQALAQREQDHIRDATEKVYPEWIEDGFGTMWQKCGKKDCGKFVVKIGKVDCWNGDCQEAGVKT